MDSSSLLVITTVLPGRYYLLTDEEIEAHLLQKSRNPNGQGWSLKPVLLYAKPKAIFQSQSDHTLKDLWKVGSKHWDISCTSSI